MGQRPVNKLFGNKSLIRNNDFFSIPVGLGFGLQEIFANIISGLMILFEKPIRIGDTVTIRNAVFG